MPERRIFPDVILATPRLRLRPFAASDAEAVLAAANDEVIQTWLPLPRPYTRADADAWCQDVAPAARTTGGGLVRAVEAEGRLVGSIDLKRTDWLTGATEIGYWVAPGARGKGFMTEATTALAEWVLREMGFARVELRVATGNVASHRVAQKCGFQLEGVARSAGYTHGGVVDLAIYSLIQSDLQPS